MSLSEIDGTTLIGVDNAYETHSTDQGLSSSRAEALELATKHQPSPDNSRQRKTVFGKLIKSTQTLYDHFGQNTWILDRRLETLDQNNVHDQAVTFLASMVPKTSKTKHLYGMIDTYLERPIASRMSGPQVDETISMIELGVWRITDNPIVAVALLDILAGLYETRFELRNDLADIDKSIERRSQATSLTSVDPSGHPGLFNNQGNSYLTRYRRSRDPSDVDRAIEILAHTVGLVSGQDRTFKSTVLHNLGAAYSTRFQHSSVLSDNDEAIKCFSQALSVLPDGHKALPGKFESLGNAYWSRFGRLGQIDDIDRAISNHKRAVSLTPSGDLRKLARLCNLGAAYQSRFERQGASEDIQNAIDCLSQTVALAPPGYPELSTALSNLGSAYRSRFQAQGQPADVQKAIELLIQALALSSSNESSNTPSYHANLGIAYQSRFQTLSELEDLRLAIHHETQALHLTPNGSTNKPLWLSNLGVSYHSLYMHIGDLKDLERAIECHGEAVLLTPDEHPGMPRRLNSLGVSYKSRFERLGQILDLNKAADNIGRAVSLATEGHSGYPVWLANLGAVFLDKSTQHGNTQSLDVAIDHLNKAISLVPNGHPELSYWLDTLGVALTKRSKQKSTLEDVNQAIECQTQAVSLIPDRHIGRPTRLNNLGNSYHCRFEIQQNDDDIDNAIEYQTLAVSLAPRGGIGMPSLLSNLGSSYNSRFEFSGILEDIDRAINYGNEAVSLTRDWDSLKPARLNNLGNTYHQRFDRLREPEDLAKALKYREQAVLLAPEGHPDLSSLLRNLATSYKIRFKLFGELGDFDKANTHYNQALSLVSTEDIDKANCFKGLGGVYVERYRKFRQRSDINKAIGYLNHAVDLTPGSHAKFSFRLHEHCQALKERYMDRGGTMADAQEAIHYLSVADTCIPASHVLHAAILSDLGEVYYSRYVQSDRLEDMKMASKILQEAADVSTGPPIYRFQASWNLARISLQHDTTSSLKVYKQTMGLLHQMIWLGAAIGRRYEQISESAIVATEAAAVAIDSQEYALALEWLEQGRSIVWNQMLQLRNPLDELSDTDPDIARELKKIAKRIDKLSSFEVDRTLLSNDETTMEQAAQEHRRLAEQWENLLDKARHLPGMSNLLRPKRFSELAQAAEFSTVVVLLLDTFRKRCGALIIPQNTTYITHLDLSNFYETAAQSHAELVGSLQYAHLRNRGFRRPVFEETESEGNFEGVLGTLWDHIASPVLDHLGYLRIDGDLPRITWCATGSLAFLPIHAAGYYDKSSARVFDYVISSYTPTLSALLGSLQSSASFRGILAVGQADTAGCAPLPGTVAELEAIKTQSSGLHYTQLDGSNATPEAVITGMEVHDWVHLACHGSQNTVDPTKSAFHLHGGTLDLSTITRRSMTGASLAFLSACQTATGDEKLPEEAVHLAAGMMVAGYRSVIATMWSIHDGDAPLIADKVYGSLLEGGKPDASRTARALHDAVAQLRDKVGEKEYSRWVPYVHFGR
ncbi:hypothetical protein FRC12_024122 [Ceratobasidium sp. 428]|nr:hypothetical protein FRC12_024122 [Ceratobasidium sp. 428]